MVCTATSTTLAVAHIAAACSTVSGTGTSWAAAEITAEQCAAHQSGAAGLAHFIGGRDGAASLVALLLALVSPSNNEHGGTIRTRDAERSDRNTGRCSPLRSRRLLSTGTTKSVLTARSTIVVRVTTSIRARGTIESGSKPDGNGRVDLAGQVAGEGFILVVESRIWRLNIVGQLVDFGVRIPKAGLGGDITKSS